MARSPGPFPGLRMNDPGYGLLVTLRLEGVTDYRWQVAAAECCTGVVSLDSMPWVVVLLLHHHLHQIRNPCARDCVPLLESRWGRS